MKYTLILLNNSNNPTAITPERILAVDLQIHAVCFLEYMHKWKEAKQKENSKSKDI